MSSNERPNTVPTNVKELRSFMGFCGYYRKFIQNFSKLAKCLHKLTEKGRKFEWTNECQSAFPMASLLASVSSINFLKKSG
jgi:hypothetical protein